MRYGRCNRPALFILVSRFPVLGDVAGAAAPYGAISLQNARAARFCCSIRAYPWVRGFPPQRPRSGDTCCP